MNKNFLIAGSLLIGALTLQACATTKIQSDIAGAPYSLDDYIPGVFDCSNMANMLREYMLGKGYDVKLLVYWTDPSAKDSHTLVLIDNSVLIDPVLKKGIKQSPSDFPGAIIIQSPEVLKPYRTPEEWNREWGYK